MTSEHEKARQRAKSLRYYYRNREKKLAYQRAYGERNREAVRERCRRYREAHREELSAAQRRRNETQREKQAAYAREWSRANPARKAATQADWARRNPERHQKIVQAISARRRARVRAAIGSFTTAEWRDKVAQHGGRCAYCGSSGRLEIDHVVPLSRGGTNYIDNIVPACRRCNASKWTRTAEEFAERSAA